MHKSNGQINFCDISSGVLGGISCNMSPVLDSPELNIFFGSIPTSVAAGALVHALRPKQSKSARLMERLGARLESDRFTYLDGSDGDLCNITMGFMGKAQKIRVDVLHRDPARRLLALCALLQFWSHRSDFGASAVSEQTLFNRVGFGWIYHVVPGRSGRLVVHVSHDVEGENAGGLELRWKDRSTLSLGADRLTSPSIEFVWSRGSLEVLYSRCRVVLRPISLERDISDSTRTATRNEQHARFITEFVLTKETSYEWNNQITPASYASRSESDVQASNRELDIQLPAEFLAWPEKRSNHENTRSCSKQIN